MPNEIMTKLTFDNEEIAELVEKLAKDSLSDEEEIRLCRENEEEFNQYIKENPYETDPCHEFIWKKYNKIMTMTDHLRCFDDFGDPTCLYRKYNCIWMCTAWKPYFDLIENINKLLNIHIIANVEESLSECYEGVKRKEFYKII